jgi:hypothetical protein
MVVGFISTFVSIQLTLQKAHHSLRSWEVNFGYVEHGEKKNALVKLSRCNCSINQNSHGVF